MKSAQSNRKTQPAKTRHQPPDVGANASTDTSRLDGGFNRLGTVLRRFTIWWQYGALAIIILLPVMLPGYVLTLDMVFTPHLSWPAEVTSTYPLDILLWLLGRVLPGDVVQKLVLLALLLLAGVGAHLLVKELSPAKWQIAAYFAGLFYVINPFIYARLMAGQWLVLLGYALLPFLVRALFRLLAQPSWRLAAIVSLWAFAAVAVSVHMIGVVVILGVLFLIAAAVKYWRHKAKIIAVAWRIAAAGGMTLLMASYWLVPALLGYGVAGEIAARAGETEFGAFATYGGPLGTVGEVLRLQGFWVEARQLFVLPQDVVPLWGILVLLLWVLVALGAVQAWKRNRPAAVVALGAIAAGVVLAASPLVQWLAQSFPLLGGFREPHKFTMLVVIGYAVLGAYGTAWLAGRRRARAWAMGCLVLPLLITPTMLWVGGGQLQSVDYPRQWYALNDQLKARVRPSEKTLFLPWHMYAPYSFSNGRIIASPAEKFFEVPMVVSDDPEFENVAPNQADTTKRKIAQLLESPETATETLLSLGIHYVVLAKEQSWQQYQFMEKWTKVHEDEKLILYEVGK